MEIKELGGMEKKGKLGKFITPNIEIRECPIDFGVSKNQTEE